MRFGFVAHPLNPLQRRLFGVRAGDLALATGRESDRTAPSLIDRLSLDLPDGRILEGVLVGLPHLPEVLLSDQRAGVDAVVEAVGLCHHLGAEIVGLGAVAAIIGAGGRAVAERAPCPITTGNTFTAHAAVDTMYAWMDATGPAAIALQGLPGTVASGILRRLIAAGETVQVVDPDANPRVRRLIERAEGPGRAVRIADGLEALANGAVLIGASDTGGRLHRSALPSGSVVIDVAAPQDVLLDGEPRDDVLIIDGEYVRLPGALLGGQVWRRIYSMVTGQSRHVFACYAEPMLLAAAGVDTPRSVGRDVPLDRMRALARLAAEHGFVVDGVRERGRRVGAARADAFRRPATALTAAPRDAD